MTVEDVDKVIRNNLKFGKAAGADNITTEHLVYAHHAVVTHLTRLFNAMIIHGYVPLNSLDTALSYPWLKTDLMISAS